MLALSGALYFARHRSPLIVPVCCSPFGIVFKTNRCFVRRPFLPRPERLLLADSVEKVGSAASGLSGVPAVEVAGTHFKLPFGVSLSFAGESGSWGESPVVNIDFEDGCSLMQVKS